MKLNDLGVSLQDWDIVLVTIGSDGHATGPDVECKQCVFHQVTNNSTATFTRRSTSTQTMNVPADQDSMFWIPVPNLNQLYFTGTANDTIKILWTK